MAVVQRELLELQGATAAHTGRDPADGQQRVGVAGGRPSLLMTPAYDPVGIVHIKADHGCPGHAAVDQHLEPAEWSLVGIVGGLTSKFVEHVGCGGAVENLLELAVIEFDVRGDPYATTLASRVHGVELGL